MKRLAFLCFLLLLALALSLPAAAEALPNGDGVIEDFNAFREVIPEEVLELLPADFFSDDPITVGKGVEAASAPAAVLSLVLRQLTASLRGALSLLARLSALVILSALIRSTSVREGQGTGETLGFFVTLGITLLMLGSDMNVFFKVRAFVNTLTTMINALIPMMGTLYAMGGNLSAAVASSGTMALFLTVAESLCATTLLPVATVCLSLSLVGVVGKGPSLAPLTALIKRSYTWFFSLVMLLLVGALGLQTTLAKGTDTLALRTVRFATGSFLPVVGGSVAETLRTVAGSVTFLRSVVGSGAIVVLFLVFLPVFLSVLCHRLALLLSATVARLFGCNGEAGVLSELASIYGYFLAVIAALFVMCVFSLTLLAKCATAI